MPSHSVRIARKYPIEAEQALLRLVVIDGHSIVHASRLIAQGRGNCPQVDFGHSAYKVIKRGRERFEETNEIALRASIDRVLNDLAVKTMRQAREVLKADDVDPTRLRNTMIALREAKKELEAPEKKAEKKPGPRTVVEPVEPAPGEDDVVGGLLKLAQNGVK